MSWRDSLWAAAAVATHIGAQAQENISHTLHSAAAKAQATYQDYQQAPTEPPSTNGHSTHSSDPADLPPSSSSSSFSSDASASLASLASLPLHPPLLRLLPLPPTSLPSLFTSSLSLHPLPPTHNTAPNPADTAHSEREQLLPTLPSHPPTPPPTITLDGSDLDDLPPLIVTKSTLTPLKLFTGHPSSSDSSALRRSPLHHSRPLSTRRDLLPSPPPHAPQPHMEGRLQAQVQLFAAQDDMMEDMRGSIARLGEMSISIGGEVREQEALLEGGGGGDGGERGADGEQPAEAGEDPQGSTALPPVCHRGTHSRRRRPLLGSILRVKGRRRGGEEV